MSPFVKQRAVPILAVISVGTVAAAVSVGAGTALAATVECGQVIVRDTVVSNDLVNCPVDGLVIGAPDIKLDLGGQIIDGVNTANSAGIDNSGGFDNVEIVGGTVQQFPEGVVLKAARGNRLEELTLLQNHAGISLVGSDDNQIVHNKVGDSFDGIILLDSDANGVRHNVAFDSSSSGIVIGSGSDNNTIEQNRSFDNNAWGIVGGGGRQNTYARNVVFSNGNVGIEQFDSTDLVIADNYVFYNGRGIVLNNTDSSSVRKNRVRWSNVEDGIQVIFGSTGNLIRHNRSAENEDDGFQISSTGNTITNNRANYNIDLGIDAAAGNIDGGRNAARGNGNPLQCVGVSCA